MFHNVPGEELVLDTKYIRRFLGEAGIYFCDKLPSVMLGSWSKWSQYRMCVDLMMLEETSIEGYPNQW